MDLLSTNNIILVFMMEIKESCETYGINSSILFLGAVIQGGLLIHKT